MERVRRAVGRAFSAVSARKIVNGLRRRLRGGRSQGYGSAPLGEHLASQNSSAQAGKAEPQQSTDRVCSAQEFRWKELAAFESRRRCSRERALEVAAETAEEAQVARDLLKEEVPLAVPKVCRRQRPAHWGRERSCSRSFSRKGTHCPRCAREKAAQAQENAALQAPTGSHGAGPTRPLRAAGRGQLKLSKLFRAPSWDPLHIPVPSAKQAI
ncbi:uncharacterized protein GJ701_017269 [Geothlypis trichas]